MPRLKTLIIAIMVMVLTVASAKPAYCGGPLSKLTRGFLNIVTCPLELFNEEGDPSIYDRELILSLFKLPNRVLRVGKRAVVGAYETATFFIPIPQSYEPIMSDPEYFFELDRTPGSI